MKTLSKITLAAIAALLLMAPAAFAAGGSCSANSGGNYCGGKAASGCYCDDECVNYGDCCGDVEDVCNGGNQPEPQPDPVQPAPEAYELDCYDEEELRNQVGPRLESFLIVRCDEGYRAVGGGAEITNAFNAEPFDVDFHSYPSPDLDRDWRIEFRNRNLAGILDIMGRARCCR